MNKFGLLLSVLLLAGTSNISAQMDASIKLNEVMTSNSSSLPNTECATLGLRLRTSLTLPTTSVECMLRQIAPYLTAR